MNDGCCTLQWRVFIVCLLGPLVGSLSHGRSGVVCAFALHSGWGLRATLCLAAALGRDSGAIRSGVFLVGVGRVKRRVGGGKDKRDSSERNSGERRGGGETRDGVLFGIGIVEISSTGNARANALRIIVKFRSRVLRFRHRGRGDDRGWRG